MDARKLIALLVTLAIAALAAGCSCMGPSGGRKPAPKAAAAADDLPAAQLPEDTADTAVSTAVSASRNLRIKRAPLLAANLETALGLTGTDLCSEAGELSCLGDAHNVTLGGLSAYEAGIFRGWNESPATAPLALERVVATGCKRRIDLDAATPEDAFLWQGQEPKAYVTEVYRRFLARDPTDAELASALAEESELRPADWAWVVCFAVGTSIETLFY